MKRFFVFLVLTVFVAVFCPAALAQNAGYDLFQTGSGTSVDLSSLGVGVVNLQGQSIQSNAGNTDTIIHRTQNVPTGGGQVTVNVYALFMKSTSPVTYQGQSADVYVTINNTGGNVSTSTLPQPDTLNPSTGTLNVSTGGTFDSSITVNADLIFVKAGSPVGNSGNWIFHGAANATTLSSSGSSWSTTAPSGYPAPSGLPSGGFYPISVGGGGHSTPTHVHAVVPARCGAGAPTKSSPAYQRALAAGDRQAILMCVVLTE